MNYIFILFNFYLCFSIICGSHVSHVLILFNCYLLSTIFTSKFQLSLKLFPALQISLRFFSEIVNRVTNHK